MVAGQEIELEGGRGSRKKTRLVPLLAYASALVVAFPFLWALRSSLFPGQGALRIPPEWFPHGLTLEHFTDLLRGQPFLLYIWNSLFIALVTAVGQVVTAGMAGYAFARLEFPGRNKIFLVYLATMMIPVQVTIIPQYLLMSYLGWIDNYAALIVPGLATAFSTFLVRQFIVSLPREFEEAARIDGAGYFKTFFLIVVPLCKTALSTVGLLAFMTSWSSFMWPSVVISSTSLRTVPVGLAALQNTTGFTDYSQIMAGSVLGILPMFILFLLAQKLVVSAASSSGLKG